MINGDAIMYILAKRLKNKGMLNSDTVVATVMSNSGFFASLADNGIKYEQTTVGDRFVYECMQKNNYSLGGEESGHIILKKYATTGDGLLTAIMLAEEMCDTKTALSKLTDGLKVYPHTLMNVKVRDKQAVMQDTEVQKALAQVETLINGKGRALLRQSGTEPKIRVMIEAESAEKCKEYAQMIVNVIVERGHSIE